MTVQQAFANPSDVAMHATYLFPLNQDAAVFEMTMEVGDERIRADIQKVEQAEQIFQQAKHEGRSAALLKQHRPNMFTQDVANLMPGLPIVVTLRYVQTVPRVDGDYELVIPLVVGPRFQPPGSGVKPEQVSAIDDTIVDGNVAEDIAGGANNANSQTSFGRWELEQLPSYPPVAGLHIPDLIDQDRVSLDVEINSGGIPIQFIDSATHAVSVQELSSSQQHIALSQGRTIDNRDFILRYGLAGDETHAGLLNHFDERGGFFSLLLEPPANPAAKSIQAREIVFVLDCSGSMSGLPMTASKSLARTMLQNLRSDDNFRLIRFSDKATEFSVRPLPATAQNIQRGVQYLNGLHGSGGTMMSSGIRQALTAPLGLVPK